MNRPLSTAHLPTRKHPRLPLPIYRQGHLFFLTIGTHDRIPWFKTCPGLTTQAQETLQALIQAREGMLFAWSFMPDHVHILLQDEDLLELVRLFKGRLTPIARAVDSTSKLWQTSFYDHALRKEESVLKVAAYIWENPVRAGLVDEPWQYPWSGSGVWSDWRTLYARGAPGGG